MLQDVVVKGDRFVVERNGEPIAVIVPVQLYGQWKRRREAFSKRIRTAATQSSKYEALSGEEVAAIATEAVKAVRATKPQA